MAQNPSGDKVGALEDLFSRGGGSAVTTRRNTSRAAAAAPSIRGGYHLPGLDETPALGSALPTRGQAASYGTLPNASSKRGSGSALAGLDDSGGGFG
eukprot:CAMPEP_0206364388 /NCGR_PEP_ID=MMETSP0294-20121207/2183_1 /ASSEMBLY_ACC=CAM_ASM_000327 /TAXON_ID=39354 /ORGANISM="Heterosigma akashiwo, Strain CCMP2393" /LENGTH=96 /DNA_ID=CAMNT_0053809965 /DNA_START=295 /DNA_END=582 /DNA_ORIENTATION=+